MPNVLFVVKDATVCKAHVKLLSSKKYTIEVCGNYGQALNSGSQGHDASQTIGKLDDLDFLPALNLKYNIDEGTQIRMSYGRTLARPSFREIAPTAWFDFETSFQFIGNPELKRTLVNNFDLRIEKYLPGAGLISVSGFYKQFNNYASARD